MEVHAHSHTPRKKWTHYFWEFLMLFLAVFCGFLAEYKLEHIVEQTKEKEYMKSMLEDLGQDTTEVNRVTAKTSGSYYNLDTLLTLLELPVVEDSNDLKALYNKHYIDVGADLATFSQRTISQLKNAGGLRMVRIKNVADSISLYDSRTQELSAIFKSFDEISSEAFKMGTLIFDSRYYRHNFEGGGVKLLTSDKQILRQYANYVFMVQGVGGYYHAYLTRQKQLAAKLIVLIKKEYHL